MSNFQKGVLIALALISGAVIGLGTLVFLRLGASSNPTSPVSNTITAPVTEVLNQKPAVDSFSTTKIELSSQAQLQLASLSASLEETQASLAALTAKVANLENSPTPLAATATQSESTFTKDTLYLGSATARKREWQDTGLEITINSEDYPDGVHAYFEAGLAVEGGIAFARLKNITTDNVLVPTEISTDSRSTTWKKSGVFYLDHGYNTYLVQIRSSSAELQTMSGARIVIEK